MTTDNLPPLTGRGPERLATVVFYTGLVFSFLSLVYLFWAYLTDILLSLLLCGLARPGYLKLRDRLGGRRVIASALVTTGILILISIPAAYLVASLSVEAATLFEMTRDNLSVEKVQNFLFGDSPVSVFLRTIADRVGVEYTPERVGGMLSGFAGTVAAFLYSTVNAVIGNLLSGGLHIMLITVLLFYLLIDVPRLKAYAFELSPLPDTEEELLVTKFKDVGMAILFGNGAGSVIQGVLGGIAMWMAGLPSPVLWGTVMSVFAFLPVIGISVVVIPATAYLFIDGRPWTAAIFFIFCGLLSLFVENIVKTKLIGNHMKMHDMLIFMAIMGGITVFGVLGILYGPLMVVFFLTMVQLYKQHYIHRFGDSTEDLRRLPAHLSGPSEPAP